jgi:acyl carrier protein
MADTLTIADRVRRIIADHLIQPIGTVTDDARLIEDLGADSLDLVELSVALEEAFEVHIEDDAIDNWHTAGNLVKTIEGLR